QNPPRFRAHHKVDRFGRGGANKIVLLVVLELPFGTAGEAPRAAEAGPEVADDVADICQVSVAIRHLRRAIVVPARDPGGTLFFAVSIILPGRAFRFPCAVDFVVYSLQIPVVEQGHHDAKAVQFLAATEGIVSPSPGAELSLVGWDTFQPRVGD